MILFLSYSKRLSQLHTLGACERKCAKRKKANVEVLVWGTLKKIHEKNGYKIIGFFMIQKHFMTPKHNVSSNDKSACGISGGGM